MGAHAEPLPPPCKQIMAQDPSRTFRKAGLIDNTCSCARLTGKAADIYLRENGSATVLAFCLGRKRRDLCPVSDTVTSLDLVTWLVCRQNSSSWLKEIYCLELAIHERIGCDISVARLLEVYDDARGILRETSDLQERPPPTKHKDELESTPLTFQHTDHAHRPPLPLPPTTPEPRIPLHTSHTIESAPFSQSKLHSVGLANRHIR